MKTTAIEIKLIRPTTRGAKNALLACKTELERLRLIRESGKPRANHCLDLETYEDFYAPQIGKYRVLPNLKKQSYRFETSAEAMKVASKMYEYLVNRINELEQLEKEQ